MPSVKKLIKQWEARAAGAAPAPTAGGEALQDSLKDPLTSGGSAPAPVVEEKLAEAEEKEVESEGGATIDPTVEEKAMVGGGTHDEVVDKLTALRRAEAEERAYREEKGLGPVESSGAEAEAEEKLDEKG